MYKNEHLCLLAAYAISLLVYDMGDSTEQPFAVNTCAGRTEVLACYMGKSREAGLVGFPVLQRAGIPGNGGFAQVCVYLKSNINSGLSSFLQSIDSAAAWNTGSTFNCFAWPPSIYVHLMCFHERRLLYERNYTTKVYYYCYYY